MNVAHVRKAAPQMREQRRLARDAAEQQMLQPAADDGVEQRVLALGHGGHVDDMALARLAVVLREFAKRALHLAHVRQQAALHHDLGFRRHANFVGHAFHHRQRSPCNAPAMVSSSKSSGAIACDDKSVSGSTPMTMATSSGFPARSASSKSIWV
jgi:hypothetical protein